MSKHPVSSTNFIKHLDAFFEIVKRCDVIHYGNIATYISLFRLWNMSYFNNPFTPTREEIMLYSGFRSKDAFYKNLRELEALDLIRYYPSHSRFERSYFCLSSIEIVETHIVVKVWSLTNHAQLDKTKQTSLEFPKSASNQNSKPIDLGSKIKTYNGRGLLVLEKTVNIDIYQDQTPFQSSSYNPLTDPKYASHIDNRISSHSNKSNYANYQDSQSRGSSLRPSGVPIDPEADYSIKL